jgi:hypothetical protein
MPHHAGLSAEKRFERRRLQQESVRMPARGQALGGQPTLGGLLSPRPKGQSTRPQGASELSEPPFVRRQGDFAWEFSIILPGNNAVDTKPVRKIE